MKNEMNDSESGWKDYISIDIGQFLCYLDFFLNDFFKWSRGNPDSAIFIVLSLI